MHFGFRSRRTPDYTDGVIDLFQVDIGLPEESLQFGRVLDFDIVPHGKRRAVGAISVRFGEGEGIYYYGHIGYHIDPHWQGHRWSERACRLILPLYRQAGKHSIVITTDPDNIPSQKIITGLGGILERKVTVAKPFFYKYDISPVKWRYVLKL